jgi:hypothetical protein
MERLIYDRLLEQSDPIAYQRKIEKEQRRERETGQGMWWGTED